MKRILVTSFPEHRRQVDLQVRVDADGNALPRGAIRRPAIYPLWTSAENHHQLLGRIRDPIFRDPRFLVEEELKYRCRYVLFDCYYLDGARYIGGIPSKATRPIPGTAAAYFLSPSPAEFSNTPGCRLLYRSPPSLVVNEGFPTGLMRLYRLVE